MLIRAPAVNSPVTATVQLWRPLRPPLRSLWLNASPQRTLRTRKARKGTLIVFLSILFHFHIQQV
jgi:hypothetical protein